MTKDENDRMSSEAARQSFNDAEEAHLIIEREGFAYDELVDPDLNETSALFSGVNRTEHSYSALKTCPESYTAYKQGLKHGSTFEWWPNGKLKISRTYAYGKEQGISREWHYNGVLAYEGGRREGMVDGVSRAWDDDGFQTSETCWDRGRYCGYRILWYRPSGEVEYIYDEGEAGIFDFFDRPDQSPHFTFIPKWIER